MSKFNQIIQAAQAKKEKIAVALMVAMASGLASAQATTAPTLDSVLDTFVASIVAGISTIFSKIGPFLALVYGVAFAWRWMKKGSNA